MAAQPSWAEGIRSLAMLLQTNTKFAVARLLVIHTASPWR